MPDRVISVPQATQIATKIKNKFDNVNGRLDNLTETVGPTNFIEISDDTKLRFSDNSFTAVYNDDNTVDFSFTNTANPLAFYTVNGLTSGKSYVLTFDLISGSLGSAQYQRVVTWINGPHTFVASATAENGKYTILFTASDNQLALQLQFTYASKSVTIGNVILNESNAEPELYIKNSLIRNLSRASLSDGLKEELDSNIESNSVVAFFDGNLIDISKTLGKYYINGTTGAVTATGSNMVVTDYISVDEEEIYYLGNVIHGYCAFYSDKNVESYVAGLNYQNDLTNWYYKIPATANYARFTIDMSALSSAWMSTRNVAPSDKNVRALSQYVLPNVLYPANPCDYAGTEIRIFNKIICVGDSLTQGVCNYNEGGHSVANVAFRDYSYPTYLSKVTGCEVTNKGSAGRTTAQWYSAFENTDLSGHDAAIVMLGVNDALYNHDWTQEESTALDNIIAKLKSENTGIKIFIATTPPAFFYSGPYFDAVNVGIRSYVENKNDADIVLVDLNTHGHTKDDLAFNAGHLTGYGYFILANDFVSAISWEIYKNKMSYRFVQFIGTNYSFS